MKKLILTIALLSSPAFAEEPKSDLCDSVERFARAVMDVRQNGVSLKKVIDAVGEEGTNSEEIALAAYNKPRFTSKEYQDRAINDFANDVYLECLTIK